MWLRCSDAGPNNKKGRQIFFWTTAGYTTSKAELSDKDIILLVARVDNKFKNVGAMAHRPGRHTRVGKRGNGGVPSQQDAPSLLRVRLGLFQIQGFFGDAGLNGIVLKRLPESRFIFPG